MKHYIENDSGRRKSGRVTLRDIAREADVAISTVSGILNDHPSCYAGEPVRQRVHEVAQELGYHPNLLYRGVRNLSTRTVGLIVPSLFVHQTAICVEEVEAAAWKAGYHLFIGYSHNDPAKVDSLLRDFISRRVDGLLFVAGYDCGRLPELDYVAASGPPIVAIGHVPDYDFPSVTVDYRQGGRMAIEHLVELGHRRIGYLTVKRATRSASAKMAGFEDGCKRHGLRPQTVAVADPFTMHEQIDAGAIAMRRLLEADDEISAFCALNDVMAVGAMRAARALGRQIADDISILGFDDDPMGECLETPLTTMSYDAARRGSAAFAMLERLMGDEKLESLHLNLPMRLICRASTAPFRQPQMSTELPCEKSIPH